MPKTFKVFYLGNEASIDPTEGNDISENAASLVGKTYGGPGNALTNHSHTLSQGSVKYTGGAVSDAYDSDNNGANETFRIDGGSDQTIEGTVEYNATITYNDGTTATITAIVFQDLGGNLYLAPETSLNSDQTALQAKPIRSLTLDSVADNNVNLGGNRYNGTYPVCFTSGTAIRTPCGDILIDELRVGDLVCTMDNGPQAIRWISRRHIDQPQLLATPTLRPILIRKGLLGTKRDLLVSPQHGMLFGRDNLVRAKHLAETPESGVRIAHGKRTVTYVHLMFDAHQVIFAEGAPSESFYPGPMAQRAIPDAARAELKALFPDVFRANVLREKVAFHYGETARRFMARSSVPRNLWVC